MVKGGLVFVAIVALAAASAIPAPPGVVRKLSEERYAYLRGPDGAPWLVDLWATPQDLQDAARFDPDRQNVYHLFTRDNPTVSQPLLIGVEGLLTLTNYNAQRRTIILLHGWLDSVTADFNTVLVPGESVARFINWLNSVTEAVPAMYHIVGHSLGGHQAGVVGRNVDGDVAYITALDPAFPGWITNRNRFRATDGAYTEVIHTNAGLLGYLATLGDADFYPNGGISMPGCNSQECDHKRSFYYLAESLTSGGFTGRRCATYITAMIGNCYLRGNLNMGGLVPKTGSSGIYYLETRASPPFSRG